MPLDNIFESDREAIFTTLRRPLTRLALGITVFESRVKEAVQVLEQQYKAATLERTRDAYRAEQDRLKERVRRLKRKATNEGWM